MLSIELLVLTLITACPLQIVSVPCNSIVVPNLQRILETQGPGQLFNLSKEPDATISFDVTGADRGVDAKHYPYLRGFFQDQSNDTEYMFLLNKTLDMEALIPTVDSDQFQSITITFTCTEPGQVQPRDYQVVVASINEFNPGFDYAPYQVDVNESATVNSTVFQLKGRASDMDRPKAENDFSFSIVSYGIQEFDGRGVFRIDTPLSEGIIKLNQTLDYEALRNIGRTYFMLNVSVKDSNTINAKFGYAYLNLTVLDYDDQGPKFLHPDCTLSCLAPQYFAVVDLNQLGNIDVEPNPISARDQDTLNYPVEYSIESGGSSFFVINKKTGVVTQTKKASETDAASFRLVIKAREVSANNHSAVAVLLVKVKERSPELNYTDPGTDEGRVGASMEKSGDSFLIPLIIIAVVLALVIAAALIVVLLMRRAHKRATIEPEDNKSEPSTEEEEIHSDRSDQNEKLVNVVNPVTNLPIPDGRAQRLPPLPLKDSATETEAEKPKKKNRRRKKKEPEIFDGTREYDMGAKPEFYDSSLKSKVKRSHRSYDTKTDPMYWIKVPNDNVNP